jgi:MFS family permease
MTVTTSASELTIPRRIAVVFVPFAAGYYLSYLFRNINAVIVPELVDELGLNAANLGFLTAAYFLGFTSFQIPLGILLDRFGPRRVQTTLLLIAGAGAVLFGYGQDPVVLGAGRLLIGLGVSGCLMGSFKAIVQWFPPERWALTNGLLMAIGGIGAMSATKPVAFFVAQTDWRTVFIGLGILTFAVAVSIYTIVPRRRESTPSASGPSDSTLAGLTLIYRDRLFWRLAPLSVTTFAASMSMFSLWMGPWLRDVTRLARADVDNHLLLMAAALTVGFVMIGLAGDFFGRRGISLITVMVSGLVLFILAQVPIVFGLTGATYGVVFAFGLLGNMASLVYAILSHHFPRTHSARANTGLNLLVFAGVFVIQWLMGAIIDQWPPTPSGGYDPQAYGAATGTVLALEVAALAWFLVFRPRPTAT